MKAVRPICMSAYAPPTQIPKSPNARGSAADIARLTSISSTSSSRTAIRSGSSQFVTQVVYIQASQTIASRIAVCAAPAIVVRPSR